MLDVIKIRGRIRNLLVIFVLTPNYVCSRLFNSKEKSKYKPLLEMKSMFKYDFSACSYSFFVITFISFFFFSVHANLKTVVFSL